MTVTSRSLAALALGLAFAQTASAEGTSRPLNDAARAMGEAIALDIDADGDGALTPREVAAASREVFASIDDDGDRRITPVEMVHWPLGLRDIAAFRDRAQAHEVAMTTAHDLFDRDDDGVVTQGEMSAAFEFATDYADTDGDGALSRREFRQGFILSVLLRNALTEPAA
jgi:hypothetical protein